MSLPSTDTVVLYPDGAVDNAARVLHAQAGPDGRWAIVLDQTCCHPVDAGWPDQGADRAILRRRSGTDLVVTDAVVAATDGTALFIGADIPVRKGTEGWAFLVAHLTQEPLTEGETVTVLVNEPRRRALSVGHTACHLASLALNEAMAGHWSKDVPADALGRPDFDGAAIVSSRIHENGSVDVFRLNKSLRRKGFDTEFPVGELETIGTAITATLDAWIDTGASVRVDRDGPRLTDRRHWVCELPEASARIACGGTHVNSLAEVGPLAVTLEIADDAGTPTLTMTTSTRAQSDPATATATTSATAAAESATTSAGAH